MLIDKSSGFTPFPRLAPELRQKLWKEACCVSRIVDIWATPIGGKECREFTTHFFDRGTYFYKTNPHGTPAILHTSREARTIGLEHYTLSFGSTFIGAIGTAIVQITSPPKIWVNWDWDTIFPMKTFNYNLDDNTAGYLWVTSFMTSWRAKTRARWLLILTTRVPRFGRPGLRPIRTVPVKRLLSTVASMPFSTVPQWHAGRAGHHQSQSRWGHGKKAERCRYGP